MLKTGPSFFYCFPHFIVFWGIFENTNSVTLSQNSVFFSQNFGDVKIEVSKRKLHFLFFFFFFYVGEIETEKRKKRKMEKAKKTYKNSFFFFFNVVIQKCEKSKKWIFTKIA